MLDLGAIGLLGKAQGYLTPAQRHAANAAGAMIVYGGGFGGRSQEFENVEKEKVKQKLRVEALNHFESMNHKTAGHYGEVGKGFFPGSIEALLTLADLPGGTTGLLFEPSR